MTLYFESKLELIFTECNFYFSINITMITKEKICADILAGRLFKDKPELGEQILRELWYDIEKIKENQRRVAYFRASAEYEDYLNSIWLSSYDLRRDEQASTYEDDKEHLWREDDDSEEFEDEDLPF